MFSGVGNVSLYIIVERICVMELKLKKSRQPGSQAASQSLSQPVSQPVPKTLRLWQREIKCKWLLRSSYYAKIISPTDYVGPPFKRLECHSNSHSSIWIGIFGVGWFHKKKSITFHFRIVYDIMPKVYERNGTVRFSRETMENAEFQTYTIRLIKCEVLNENEQEKRTKSEKRKTKKK